MFIEGAKAYKHKKCILERKAFAEGVWEGVRCVRRSVVCGRVGGGVVGGVSCVV